MRQGNHETTTAGRITTATETTLIETTVASPTTTANTIVAGAETVKDTAHHIAATAETETETGTETRAETITGATIAETATIVVQRDMITTLVKTETPGPDQTRAIADTTTAAIPIIANAVTRAITAATIASQNTSDQDKTPDTRTTVHRAIANTAQDLQVRHANTTRHRTPPTPVHHHDHTQIRINRSQSDSTRAPLAIHPQKRDCVCYN
jgi:hypothetical protein